MEKTINLLPIQALITDNEAFAQNLLCEESLQMSVNYYQIIGFTPPWICYYAEKEGVLVGSAAFKGKPVHHTIEIAYGTFEPFRNQGIGAEICKALVELALETDNTLIITAKTLPEANFSTKILTKNNFTLVGTVNDPEDGEVWEWVYQKK
jgi:[ribosomal protein S5]-alanine N-acetyltransferase